MSKLSEALEEIAELKDEHGEVFEDAVTLSEAIRREHDDNGHEGHFRWCHHPACQAVGELEGQYVR